MTNYLETGVIIINILSCYDVNIGNINHLKYFHQAFTHKSYVKKDVFTDDILECSKKELGNPENLLELQYDSYERLEYFGDRVVKIVVSFYLFNRYPHEDEGFMTRLQTKIEDKKNLSVFSKKLGFGKYFIISKQIDSLNGRNMEKIHEDVFEAFMGALFLSNGFEPCCLLLLNLLETQIDYAEKLYCDNNYKDNLLRYHHKMKWKFPEYKMIGFEGPPHKRIYIMGVEKQNITDADRKKFTENKNHKELYISFGNGMSKKEAEQKASKMALILYGQLNKDQYTSNDIYYPSINEKTVIDIESEANIDSDITDDE